MVSPGNWRFGAAVYELGAKHDPRIGVKMRFLNPETGAAVTVRGGILPRPTTTSGEVELQTDLDLGLGISARFPEQKELFANDCSKASGGGSMSLLVYTSIRRIKKKERA